MSPGGHRQGEAGEGQGTEEKWHGEEHGMSGLRPGGGLMGRGSGGSAPAL